MLTMNTIFVSELFILITVHCITRLADAWMHVCAYIPAPFPFYIFEFCFFILSFPFYFCERFLLLQLLFVSAVPNTFKDFPAIYETSGFNASRLNPRTLRHLYQLDFYSREKFLDSAMITNFGETLKADGSVIDALKNGVAVPYSYPILNEWNKLVSDIAIESKGIAHLRQFLIDLRERYDSF